MNKWYIGRWINTEDFINDTNKQFAHISEQQINDYKNMITDQYDQYSDQLLDVSSREMDDADVRLKSVFEDSNMQYGGNGVYYKNHTPFCTNPLYLWKYYPYNQFLWE